MLTAFTAGLTLITVSELGDKTFFIAAILSMRHSRRWVFIGVVLALATMTILSVLLGQTASLLPDTLLKWIEVVLFLAFGIKLLYEASQMQGGAPVEEEEDAIAAVQQAEKSGGRAKNQLAIVTKAFSLTFLGEWGDRTQIATIVLATTYHPLGVATGATLGHAICAAIAVVCGRLIAGKISERTLTYLGGLLFILFGAMALFSQGKTV
jgi:putative Ca2+/H+ antiporter (TMEM165/GDT1 family)